MPAEGAAYDDQRHKREELARREKRKVSDERFVIGGGFCFVLHSGLKGDSMLLERRLTRLIDICW